MQTPDFLARDPLARGSFNFSFAEREGCGSQGGLTASAITASFSGSNRHRAVKAVPHPTAYRL